MKSNHYRYDAFISYAVEDKIPIANELSYLLENAGLKIWYAGRELTAGDSIKEVITTGLQQSRYGIVILSKQYFNKMWPLQEFFTLWEREVNGQKVILPVLYDITPAEVASKNLQLADRWSTNASKGLHVVAKDLVDAINKDRAHEQKKKGYSKLRSYGITGIILFILLSMWVYVHFSSGVLPGNEDIRKGIQHRIDKFENSISSDHELEIKTHSGKVISRDEIIQRFVQYNALDSYFRNIYELNDGRATIQFKKNVNKALHMDVSELSPINDYSLSNPNIYFFYDSLQGVERKIHYSYYNSQPLVYTIADQREVDEDTYQVDVTFDQFIRYVSVHLLMPASSSGSKRQEIIMKAYPPVETFLFKREGGKWNLAELK